MTSTGIIPKSSSPGKIKRLGTLAEMLLQVFKANPSEEFDIVPSALFKIFSLFTIADDDQLFTRTS